MYKYCIVGFAEILLACAKVKETLDSLSTNFNWFNLVSKDYIKEKSYIEKKQGLLDYITSKIDVFSYNEVII